MIAQEALTKIKKAKERWEKDVKEAQAKIPLRRHRFSTVSDLEIEGLYTPEDVKDLDYVEKLGFPGHYPFTRGVQPSMYLGRLWTMRMFSGLGGPEETNARFKYLLEHGETGLSVAFHFPTLMGYDSDSAIARGEIGKCGVAIDTLEDMEILFDGIPLDKVTTSMTINPPASVLLAMYIVVAEMQGVSRKEISGTIQNDMLKEFIAQKTFMLPPEPSIRLIVDTVEFCTHEVPRWNPISISGYHIREAGATAIQELAILRFHTQTAGVSLTAQQPYNNVIRTTCEALAAVLGGTQSLHTNSMDETYAIPAEEAAFIALRTQQIIAEETGVANTIDPLAGSYFVEALTNRIEEEAWEYIRKIDDMGGMVKAIAKGYPQAEIAESAYVYQKQIDNGEKTLIGVNKYVTDHPPILIWRMDPAIEKKQLERLKAVKTRRKNKRVKTYLERIRKAAEGDENLMPFIIDAVKEYATLQEICDVFRQVFGIYRDPGLI